MFEKPWNKLVNMGKESTCSQSCGMCMGETAKAISSALMLIYGKNMGDKSLRTLVSEAEVVVHPKALTIKKIIDANGPMAIFQACTFTQANQGKGGLGRQ